MIGLRRFIRGEIIVSAVLHAGLLVGLFALGTNGVRSVPPEAMVVEIVPASEAPQPAQPEMNFEGTPLESTTNGSELSSNLLKGSARAEPPGPKSKLPSLEQSQARTKAQREAGRAAAQAKAAAPEQPETQPQASEPLLVASAPTDQPQPHPKEAANHLDAA